jgi:hypothetical protein
MTTPTRREFLVRQINATLNEYQVAKEKVEHFLCLLLGAKCYPRGDVAPPPLVWTFSS